MQVRTGRKTSRSNLANNLANTNELAALYADLGQMAKPGCDSVTVTNLDDITVGALPAGNGHLASRRCSYRFDEAAPQIDPRMDVPDWKPLRAFGCKDPSARVLHRCDRALFRMRSLLIAAA
jgi:hypothetical protein